MTEPDAPLGSNEPETPEKKASMAADFSLILGVVSNCCFWVVASLPAIILGIIALRNIKRNPLTLTGKGRAITGIITACTGLIVSPVLMLGVSPNPFHSHQGSSRAKCVLQLSTMEKLMVSYGNLNGIKPGDEVAPSVLVDDGYISRLMICPIGGNYTYSGKMPTMESGTKAYTQCDIENHDFDPWPSKEKGKDGLLNR